jgi:hypothetical protein
LDVACAFCAFLRLYLTLPRIDDLADDFFKGHCDIPLGVVGAHFLEIADVADVVADAVLFDVGADLLFAAEFLGKLEGFKNRAGVGTSTADIVNFRHAGGGEESFDEAGDILAVDVVTDLLPFVAKDLVFTALEVAFHQIREESVEFDTGMVRARKAAAAQAARWHAEVAPVFLHHYISRNLRGSKEAVLALVNREVLRDAVGECGVIVVPAGIEFLESDGVRTVTVNFVGGHVDKRGLGAGPAHGLEQVQGGNGVRVEVVERDGRRTVVARLGGRVDDRIWLDLGDEIENTLSVPDINFVVRIAGDQVGNTGLIPLRVALRTEKDRALVVVNTVDGVTLPGKAQCDFRADKAKGTGGEDYHGGIGKRKNVAPASR